jgi:hypothetical protein
MLVEKFKRVCFSSRFRLKKWESGDSYPCCHQNLGRTPFVQPKFQISKLNICINKGVRVGAFFIFKVASVTMPQL